MFSIISPIVLLDEELLERTKLFFGDIRAGMKPEDELIIIDNGSRIGREMLMKKADIYIHTPDPIGYGPTLNLGLKVANGDVFLIPNNDMRVSPEWRQKMLEKFKDKVGIVSCHGPHMIPSTGTAFNGIFWAVKKEVVNDIGYFESFRPREPDDSDFCIRAIVAGWDIDTAEFVYDHPERKSTHNQTNFDIIIKDSPQWKNKSFFEKWGFKEQEWYRKALEMRKI